MDIDDLEPAKPQTALRNLDPLSVEELERHIAELESEIARARTAIAAKQNVRAGAESLFRK